jgi:hypothetical protein
MLVSSTVIEKLNCKVGSGPGEMGEKGMRILASSCGFE